MTPAPSFTERPSPPRPGGDEIVITGLSGLFPSCYNVNEFSNKLYGHMYLCFVLIIFYLQEVRKSENLVTKDNVRWEKHMEAPEHCGVVPNLSKFDAQFFMIHYRLCASMDPMSRKLLEQAYQAVFDAGISPDKLSGTSLGVFIAVSSTECEKLSDENSAFTLTGTNRPMFANRISFLFNGKGPSMTIDSGCSGSVLCIQKAVEAMKRGDCESAIVGGSNIHMQAYSAVHYGRMFRLNNDGKMKCFDKNADGQAMSECISVMYLQKAKHAKRIYATICDVGSEFGRDLLEIDHYNRYGPQRDPSKLYEFISEFYKKAKISPLDVEYVEAFGSAFLEADKTELEAIQEVFCKNRNDPLYIGSVMSNMGYSQAATTMAALTKMCLAYQTGKIPANLHYETPRTDISAVSDGRMRILTENRPFSRSYTAINCMSFAGMNGHVLLKGRFKPKNIKRYQTTIPYLLAVSGRQESAVEFIFEDFKAHPLDPEEIALMHNLNKVRITKHLARGYTILTTDENKKTVSLKEKVEYFDDAKKPLWFVFGGMGSQWNGMGRELLRIPIFAAAIQKCHKTLEPFGLNLLHILTSDDKKIFENILNSFVGITAVQIGLTDVLQALGLVPDNIIGHSVGELPCAYADGCLSAEQVILASYYRGLVSVETTFIHGRMAAVGLGYQEVKPMCPNTIEVACHNSATSSTLSGPTNDMREFIEILNSKSIFAKEVNTSNIAYHSSYVKDAGPALLHHLKMLIKDPKPRSKKWLSTSVPKTGWEEPEAQLCCAEYFTNNLLNPVLFEETAEAIPTDAILVEIGPHGLLQAILKRSLPQTCSNIPLTRRGHPDSARFLLEAVGELFMVGLSPDVGILYPKVEFPVSTETRSLSHLLEWAYDEEWALPQYHDDEKHQSATYDLTLSTHDPEFEFLRGHIINDDTLYPFAGALVLVWDTLAMSLGLIRKEISVQFSEIHFFTQPPLSDDRLTRLTVEIHRGSGKFQVVNENIVIATGFIEKATKTDAAFKENYFKGIEYGKMVYSTNDIYRMFYDRGYKYRGEFRSIQKENADKTHAIISWENNWVTFIDAAIQMNVLRREGDITEQLRFIQRLVIDVKSHQMAVCTMEGDRNALEAYYHGDKMITRCGGLLLDGLLFANSPPRKSNYLGLKRLQFTPYFGKDVVDVSTALYTFLQIIEENTNSIMNALEISENKNDSYLGNKIKELLPEIPSIKLDIKQITLKDVSESKCKVGTPDFMLVDNGLTDKNINDVLAHQVPPKVFIIVLEDGPVSQSAYKAVASAITPIGRLVLGIWGSRDQRKIDVPIVVNATSSRDIINLISARNNLAPKGSLYVLTHYPPINELEILVRHWRKEEKKNKVSMVIVDEISTQSLETKQLSEVNFAFNVLHNGTWGGYYFTRCGKINGKEQRTVVLKSANIGVVDSLHWTEAPEMQQNDVPVTVHYAGLNFYDAKKATGDILGSPEEVTGQRYGMDFSGVTDRGERVMGVVSGGAAASRVAAQPSLLWPVPKHWTLEEAATVPLAYTHAFYCFGLKCELRPGMKVLVHGGTGALGQAAITIALANKCTVFTTVSDAKKKRFLMDLFPQINGDYIGYSRNYSFGDMIMEETQGEGCDIILSCVKGNMKHITLSSCGAYGTTLDTQEVHSKEAFQYGMYHMMKCRSYIVIDFKTVFAPESAADMKKLQLMVSDGIARGYVRPLSRVVYGAHDAARGLRLLAASRHRGKVLVRIHGEDLLATNRLLVQAYSSNLVLSAADDITLAVRIVDMLISRGAINIILYLLNNKEGEEDMYLADKMKQWQKLGGKVTKVFGTLNSTAKVEELITTCNGLGPVDGLYVIAEACDTIVKETMSHLISLFDIVARKSCPAIRHFCVINNDGDIGRNICIKRTLDQLPGLMLQIQNIDKFNPTNEDVKEINARMDSVSIRNVMEYVENALCLSGPITVVYSYRREENLMEKASAIINLNLKYQSNDNKLTIRELGLTSEQTQELIELLQNYNLTKEQVLSLTIGKLTTLQFNQVRSRTLTGLEVLYSTFETDEISAACELKSLPTPIQNSSILQRDYEFDTNAEYLIMVPGMDGHYKKFETVCHRLKLCAVACQPGYDNPHETISQLAERLTKMVIKKLQPKGRFYLLGYSFGVLVALEMAAILEQHGLTGIVFCVDASPNTFRSAMETLLLDAGAKDSGELQNAIVYHVYSILSGQCSDRLTVELQRLTGWDEKVEAGVRALIKEGYSKQFVRAVIETAYSRINQVRQYDCRQLRLLTSQLVLLRCPSSSTDPDLGLSLFSKCTPHVYDLTATHCNALDDLSCANIINSYLDKSILEVFYKMNLCNSYIHS